MRERFAQALADAVHAADSRPGLVAAHVGLTDDAVRKWMSGRAEPPPLTVFRVEAFLDVPPGELSRHLGYLPVGAPPSVADALEADDQLTPAARRLIIAAWREGRRG